MALIPIRYNLRSMKARITPTLVAVFGIAGVVAVFLAMLSMSRGFLETVKTAGAPDNAIVLKAGSQSEMQSFMPLADAKLIADSAGVRRDEEKNPLVSMEIVRGGAFVRLDNGMQQNVSMRGVAGKPFHVHEKIKLARGRMFTPGLAEFVVGKSVAASYNNLQLDSRVSFGGITWTVVGIVDAGNSSFDSAIWCDAALLKQAFKIPFDMYQSIIVKLSSSAEFEAFKSRVAADPRLNVDVERETVFYANQSKGITTLISGLGFLVAFIMGIGAVFAALNTMFAAVGARSSEIATMRALGFRSGNVVLSFLAESMIIAFCGGVAGCLLVLPLNGFTASTFDLASFSMVHFAFMVTPDLMVQGIVFALVMGFFGGLFPALRAARQPIAATLRGM